MAYFQTPQFRLARTSLFLALGLSGVFPFFHILHIYGVA